MKDKIGAKDVISFVLNGEPVKQQDVKQSSQFTSDQAREAVRLAREARLRRDQEDND